MSTTHPEGYFALPPDGKGRPVLVLHAWWGLNDTIKTFCNRLAAAGFVAFAPDIYHGTVTDQIAEAEKLVGAMDAKADQARAEVKAAAAFLNAQSDSGIAVIGFSMGAYYALDLSASAPEAVKSVVVFYGSGPADFTRSKADYLAHFAGEDPYEPQENVEWLLDAMKQAGRSATFHTYPGTGHWFFEPDRADAYNQPAADLAWERTLAFLNRSS